MAYGSSFGSNSSWLLSGRAAHGLARGLGWFSIGVGIVELLAPRALARGMGVPDRETVIRSFGLREIVTGVGILASRNPAPWLWARVAGDALDLATLANAADRYNPRRSMAMAGMAVVAGVAALDVLSAASLSGRRSGRERVLEWIRDYRGRSGLPRPVEAMRGIAQEIFSGRRAMRGAEMPRPYLR